MKRNWTRFIIFVSCILILFPIFTYAEDKDLDKVVLQLRWNHQFQFAGYYAANWMGYYADEGLEVEIRPGRLENGTTVNAVEEVLNGNADFGIGALDILLIDDIENKISIVASIFQRSATTFYMNRDTPYNSIYDMINLNVGRREKDLLDIEFQTMLIQEGIDPDILSLIDENEIFKPEDITNNKFQVIPGISGGIIEFYAAKDGFNFKAIKPIDYGIDFYGDSIFTTKELAYGNPELVERFRRASIRGWEYALENPEGIIKRISQEFKNDELRSMDDFQDYNRYRAGKVQGLILYPVVELGNINPYRWQKMCESIYKLGLTDKCIDVDNIIFDYKKIQEERNALTIKRTINILITIITLSTLFYISSLQSKNKILKKELEDNKRKEGLILYQSRLAAMGEMIGNIAHQWRQPLNNLNLILSNLEDIYIYDERDEEYFIGSINRGKMLTKQMSNTIDDFRYFFDPKDEISEFYIINCVKLTLDILADKIKQKDINIILDNIAFITVYGHENQYSQAVFSIINNSIDALSENNIEKRKVIISIYEEDKMGVCEISDNAGGVKKEIIDKIFNPYFTTKDNREGSGLGLYMTKTIIKNMEGKIDYYNSEDGFTIKLMTPKGRVCSEEYS